MSLELKSRYHRKLDSTPLGTVNGAMTLGITTLSIKTLSITTPFFVKTLCIRILSTAY